MKRTVPMLMALILISSFIFIMKAFAIDTPPMETSEFIEYLIQQFGSLQGASAFVIAGVVVQVLIKFSNSKLFDFFFSKLSGSIKLLIVLALTYISGVIGLMTSGMKFWPAVINSTSLAALMVLLNQIYKQFFTKK